MNIFELNIIKRSTGDSLWTVLNSLFYFYILVEENTVEQEFFTNHSMINEKEVTLGRKKI